MRELLPLGNSGWPASFTAGLHAALRRRIPPQVDSPELEELSRDLVLALEQGDLTVALTPERLVVAEASGWLQGETSPLLRQGDRLGWRRWLQAMEQVVDELVERAHASFPEPVNDVDPGLSARLNPEQCAAVRALDQASVVLLSGGPGTGKTSTVVEILARAEARHPGLRIGLAAPTGKAARRLGDAVLSERAPLPCSTLHRWLEAGSRGFGRHRHRPLELDLLVIDEMSMLDLALTQALLEALPSSCRLLLVGDPAQLPPVGSGAVWHRLQQPEVRDRFGAGAVHLERTYRNRGALAEMAQLLRHLGQGTMVAVGALQMHGAGTETAAHVRLLKPMPDRSTSHRRQLGWITHQQQPTTAGQRLQQSLGQGQIQHRHLVDHEEIELQRPAPVAAEPSTGSLEPTMKRAAWEIRTSGANGIRQTSRGLSGGRSQADAQIRMAGPRPLQHLHHGAGLAGAGSTTEQHHRQVIRCQHRLALLMIQAPRQIRDRTGAGDGHRPGSPLQQLIHHSLHRCEPAAPADPLPLHHQRRRLASQPAAGSRHCPALRRQRQ